MSTMVNMPQLGETVTEGTILRWAKSVGDSIAPDEVLVEISTDKVDTEVPSPVGGTILEILVAEGETVGVGTPLVVIGEAGEAPAAPEPDGQPEVSAVVSGESSLPPVGGVPGPEAPGEGGAAPEPDGQPEVSAVVSGESSLPPVGGVPGPEAPGEGGAAPAAGLVLSPVVRKLVREHGLDPGSIEGSGRGGRVTRRDVEAVIAAGAVAEPSLPPVGGVPEPEAVEPVAAQAASVAPAPVSPAAAVAPVAPAGGVSPVAPPPPVAAGGGSETVGLSRLRVRIGENMVRAKATAAHVWTSVEVDYERLERVRQAHRESFKAAEGFSLTYLPFIARATIDALLEFPVVNSEFHLEERQAVFHRSVHLGVAIDVDRQGLVVASIRNADSLRLVGLARQIRSLAEKARSGGLEPDDVAGSTFTITNPGPFGSFMSAPVINVPNVGILSTDTVSKRPSVVAGPDGSDVIAIRHIGYLGLSWDHRAFDGSTAVLFLRRIKHNIETWDWQQELA